MKKLLCLLGSITLTGVSTSTVVACNHKASNSSDDSTVIQNLIKNKVQYYLQQYLKVGNNDGPYLTDSNLISAASTYLADLEKTFSYNDDRAETITQAEFITPLNNYLNNILKTVVYTKLVNDKSIGQYFKGIKPETAIVVDNQTVYKKIPLWWNPNLSKSPNVLFGYDSAEDYKTHFNATTDITKLKYWFSIQIANFSFNLTYTDLASLKKTTIKVTTNSTQFYLINHDGYVPFYSLVTHAADKVKDFIQKITLSYDPQKGPNPIYNFTFNNNERILSKVLSEQFISKLANASQQQEEDIKLDNVTYPEEVNELGNWEPNRYNFAKNYFTHSEDILGNESGKYSTNDFKETISGDLDKRNSDFQNILNTTFTTDWVDPQGDKLVWNNQNFKTDYDTHKIYSFGRVELTKWEDKNVLLPRWKIPFIIIHDATINDYEKNIIDIATQTFAKNGSFWDNATIRYAEALGIGITGFLLKMSGQNEFNNYIQNPDKTFTDAIGTMTNKIIQNINSTYPQIDQNILNSISFNSTVPTLYDYSISISSKWENFIFNQIFPSIDTSKIALHLNYKLIQELMWPHINYNVGGFMFNLSDAPGVGFIFSGIYYGEI
ncbi:lipoprotein [Spiroplasma endosymbiont of Stenodema calcarata]|uniref:lipoprotein n=1 Tax=Spiroplasma endosymbiont of Stenodema calcarata TaxID=3139328 RepID=UPI003CCACFAA